MTGIDAAVIREQIKVVRKDQRHMQDEMRDLQEQEVAALAVEQRAHDQVIEAQRLQGVTREAIEERATTIGELQDLLELMPELLPEPRGPAD